MRLPPEVRRQLDTLSKRQGVSLTQFAQAAILREIVAIETRSHLRRLLKRRS